MTEAASAADAGIHKKKKKKKKLGSGKSTAEIISNDEMKDIIEVVESLEDSSFLPEGVSKAI